MEKQINFESYDGTSLTGIFSYPDESFRHAVLMMHGLPSDKNESGFYRDMAKFFNESSIASFRFDFRFNGESEKGSLSTLTLSEMVLDIESAYWQLSKLILPEVPISAVGTSCGGGVTLKWRNAFKRSLSNIFLMAPVLDYEFEVTGEEKCVKQAFSGLSKKTLNVLRSKGVLNDDIGYGYQMINEARLFDIGVEFSQNEVPVVIYQGTHDTIVPITITKKCISSFPEVLLVEIPDAEHGFATADDDNLTAPGTKENHYKVYKSVIEKLK